MASVGCSLCHQRIPSRQTSLRPTASYTFEGSADRLEPCGLSGTLERYPYSAGPAFAAARIILRLGHGGPFEALFCPPAGGARSPQERRPLLVDTAAAYSDDTSADQFIGGEMKYRKLGASDLSVSEISLGSWLTYGVGVDRDLMRY